VAWNAECHALSRSGPSAAGPNQAVCRALLLAACTLLSCTGAQCMTTVHCCTISHTHTPASHCMMVLSSMNPTVYCIYTLRVIVVLAAFRPTQGRVTSCLLRHALTFCPLSTATKPAAVSNCPQIQVDCVPGYTSPPFTCLSCCSRSMMTTKAQTASWVRAMCGLLPVMSGSFVNGACVASDDNFTSLQGPVTYTTL
jgi:hypothetical protein